MENFSWGSWKILEKSWIFFVSKRVGTLTDTESLFNFGCWCWELLYRSKIVHPDGGICG